MNVNRIIALYGVAFMAIPSVFVANATPLPSKGEVGGGASTSIVEVPFTQVHVTDRFWAPRIEVNRTVSIPSAFRECEKAGRFDNFALAAKNNGYQLPSFGGAGGGPTEHQGDFSFDDTDPYKVIEGASYSLAVHYDRRLDQYLDSVISLIAKAQEPDGYLTTCVTNKCYRLSGWWGRSKWEKINSHELYNSGHLIESAVAHFRATGKRNFLDVAIKNADLVCKTFGPNEGQIHRPGGHPIIEMALCKLYKVTGERKYLEGAKYFVEETGRCTDGHHPSEYSQDHKPILQQDEIVGHAVRAGYLFSGVADVAALTGDTAYQNALQRIWQNMSSKKLFITGGIGSRPQGEGFGPNYELNSHTAYCETCAAIANVYWNYRMFLATGESKYMDIVERALYNNVLSGVSLSGDRFFYDNPLESSGEHARQRWFGCACCPGNVTRFVASVPGYVYALGGVKGSERGVTSEIYVNLYVQGTAKIGKVELEQETDYPWDGKVKIRVTKGGGKFALKLRVPSWLKTSPTNNNLYTYIDRAKPYSVSVNGQSLYPENRDYITISRSWKKGDEVILDLPMDVRRIVANDNAEDLRGKVALERGPVVFCLEGNDQKDNTVFNKYILNSTEITSHFEKDLLGGVVVLEGKAKQLDIVAHEVVAHEVVAHEVVAHASQRGNAELVAHASQRGNPDIVAHASQRGNPDIVAHASQRGNTDIAINDVTFRAIPYSTWNNRGQQQMEVWVANSPLAAHPTPLETIASRAMTFSNRGPIQNDAPETAPTDGWAGGVNDQWEPKCSSDNSKPYHYWWLKRGTKESIAYKFDKPYEVSNVMVYWLDLDHYDGDFRTPESWTLYYKNDSGEWREVEQHSPYTVHRDCYNSVDFRPVTTQELKIVAQLRQGQSGGVLEWKVNYGSPLAQ